MAVEVSQVIPWGRTYGEYERMFKLGPEDLAGGVLDCGGGPASFTAELWRKGGRVVAVDPLYRESGAEIRARFEARVESVMAQVRATPDNWVWSYHRDPDDLCASRRAALEAFLADYDPGLRQHRYLVGELPALPFADAAFGLALCSHLLFLYSDLLIEAFHLRSALELCRVAREVRLFPLLTLRSEPSPHLGPVRAALEAAGFGTDIVPVDYELQRGGNQMLRIFRR
jgi:SAM-dependent methyltransferase